MGHWEEAVEAYDQTLPVLEKLAAQFPKVALHRRDLAGIHNNRGLLFKDLGRLDEAEAAYRQALPIQEKLAAEFGNDGVHVLDLSRSYCNLGYLVRDQGQSAAALDWYNKALRTLQPVLAGDARRVEARGCLRYLYAGRAEALARLGRHEEAVKDLNEAIALDEGPRRPLLRARRALYRGAPAEAVAAVDEQAQAKAVSGSTLCQCACVCVRAAAAVKDDPRLHEQYAAHAVELLRRAAAAGYPIARPMKNDQDLASLRNREDFQKLLQEIENKARPGAK
jgi:serine/threonine-protein kinase